MSGLCGICSRYALKPDYATNLAAEMAREIMYASNDVIDRWQDSNLLVIRVHHGVVNPEVQPVFNEDKSLCIFMDGEVFGYESEKKSLISNGHLFRLADNDAEYCLHLYEQLGDRAFVELNGSFLLALYNLKSHELLLVNDRFSSRPLFYYCDGERLIFGSQLRPLLKFQALPRRLDQQAVFEFFAFQRVLGERTFYQDVKVLPPASILRFRDGSLSIDQYWKMEYRDEIHSKDYYVEALADTLRKAVARRTRGNHRFGILLSGGLDSRTILAADEAGKISTAFTVGDFDNREVQIARKIATAKGCKHIFLQRDIDHYYCLVDEAVDIGDGMYRFDHAHFLGFLKEIRSECDIILHGYGLDYTFQGLYLPYAQVKVLGKTLELPSLAKLETKDLPDELLTRLSNSTITLAVEQVFHPALRKKFIISCKNAICELLQNRDTYKNPYNVWDYFVLHSLSKHFTFLCFLCIRHYLEERTVIYDNDLFDCYLAMPPAMRAKGRVFRRAIRRLSKKLSVIPNNNTGCRADMPIWVEWVLKNSVAALRKIGMLPHPKLPHLTCTNGSWPNMAELIRYNSKLRELIRQTLHDPECLNPDLFDIKVADSIFRQHVNKDRDNTTLLFLLLTFGRWHKKYGPK